MLCIEVFQLFPPPYWGRVRERVFDEHVLNTLPFIPSPQRRGDIRYLAALLRGSSLEKATFYPISYLLLYWPKHLLRCH